TPQKPFSRATTSHGPPHLSQPLRAVPAYSWAWPQRVHFSRASGDSQGLPSARVPVQKRLPYGTFASAMRPTRGSALGTSGTSIRRKPRRRLALTFDEVDERGEPRLLTPLSWVELVRCEPVPVRALPAGAATGADDPAAAGCMPH